MTAPASRPAVPLHEIAIVADPGADALPPSEQLPGQGPAAVDKALSGYIYVASETLIGLSSLALLEPW